jgi:hypothetical protein
VLGLIVTASMGTAPSAVSQTLALHEFLSAQGLDVSDGGRPPGPEGTFVLLIDLRSAREARPLLDWVRSGGHLIVASPGSETADAADVTRQGSLGVLGNETLQPGCVTPQTAGVGDISVRADDSLLRAERPRSTWCFVKGEGAYLIETPLGSGSLVALGGFSPFTDELLNKADNAALAMRVFGAHGEVVFGSPIPPEAQSSSLWSAIPKFFKVLIFEIIIASILFAIVRFRRLGKPVVERPVESIPAGELVNATGGLYRRARATAYSGQMMRDRTSESLARRTGLDRSSPRFAAGIARAANLPEERVERAFDGPEPQNDEELIKLAKELDEITRTLEGAKR